MPTPDWKTSLQQTARASSTKAKIIGLPRVDYAQHAALIRTALLAFGNNPNATFYIDGLPAEGDLPRPDLILLHPDVGVLTIENKGVPLENIVGIDNHIFRLTRNGILSTEDPFHQAERVMFGLRDLCKARFNLEEALFLSTAAFPRVRRSELEQRFQQKLPHHALFSDACHDPHEFRQQVLAFSNNAMQSARKSSKLTQQAHDAIMTILSGKALFHPPRRARVRTKDPSRLGLQVEQLELASKDATQEQKDLGRADLRGSHRLFRGVAGSGKSIMLALSVAQTLVFNREDAGTLFEHNRPKRTLVLCYNRSLVQYLRSKIDERFTRIAWDKPTDVELAVIHFEGLVRSLESKHHALRTGLDFEQKERRAAVLSQKFDALPEPDRLAVSYDAIYVDEAQDLLPAEFELLRRLVRPDEDGGHTLILFYDNAQNIYGVTPPVWEKLGINIVGRTTFLDTCLRNTRETLKFAFNVLVGSFAPEGQRVTTRQFADVASLKQRKLIEEKDGVVDVLFSLRNGPVPRVEAHPSRQAEVDALARELTRHFTHESALPSDVLILIKSDFHYKTLLAPAIEKVLPKGFSLRQVDRAHNDNKNLPLVEEGFLTISTIASAKGYDAPIVFLLGADDLEADPQGRARFYVGATRAKLMLYVSGIVSPAPSLLSEALQSAQHAGAPAARVLPAKHSFLDEPSRFQDIAVAPAQKPAPQNKCRHCGSSKLHCQQGPGGYYFACIDCTKPTLLSRTCAHCGAAARIRARGRNFLRICKACQTSTLLHTNVPLDSLES